jgi:hypothetical protein
MLGINKEDIEFLKELQHELLTQDTVCQASPRFWIVQGTVKEYGIDNRYNYDGETLVYTNGEWNEIAETLEEAYKYLTEEFEGIDRYKFELTPSSIEVYDIDDCENEANLEEIDVNDYLFDLEDVANFINLYNDNENFEVCCYRNVDKNYENTMFLTNRSCKDHIKANYYHYPKDAHSYAMTAWRSPEVEKVWNILEKINCNELIKLVDDNIR